jgi:plasmid stabilization system protein ParE
VREIVQYVAERNFAAAERLQQKLMDTPDMLADFPRIGRRVPEFQRDDLRELLQVRPYRILYLLDGEVCKIIAVIHGKRDLLKAMDEEGVEP